MQWEDSIDDLDRQSISVDNHRAVAAFVSHGLASLAAAFRLMTFGFLDFFHRIAWLASFGFIRLFALNLPSFAANDPNCFDGIHVLIEPSPRHSRPNAHSTMHRYEPSHT